MLQHATRLHLLTTLRRRATTALAAVTPAIEQREHELAALKAEAACWQSLLHKPPARKGSTAPPPQKHSAPRRRLDWSMILKELPPRFTTTDSAQKSGKPVAQAYAYVSRWMKDKKVRRGKDGYEKV